MSTETLREQIKIALESESMTSRNLRDKFGPDGVEEAEKMTDEGIIFAGFDGFGTEYSARPLPSID